MKLKQILATIAISAVTALGVIWGYGKFTKSNYDGGYGQQSALPSNYNYAGFGNDSSAPPGPVDFTQSAQAAIPAVVHIKTKTNAKQVTNSTPRKTLSAIFLETTICLTNFLVVAVVIYPSKGLPAPVY